MMLKHAIMKINTKVDLILDNVKASLNTAKVSSTSSSKVGRPKQTTVGARTTVSKKPSPVDELLPHVLARVFVKKNGSIISTPKAITIHDG